MFDDTKEMSVLMILTSPHFAIVAVSDIYSLYFTAESAVKIGDLFNATRLDFHALLS